MSAITTRLSRPGAGHAALTGDGIPFARLVRAELRKLTDTRASRWILAPLAAGAVRALRGEITSA